MFRSYFDQIADEINDRLQEYGLVTIADLTKEYNLPGDVLTQVSIQLYNSPSVCQILICCIDCLMIFRNIFCYFKCFQSLSKDPV